MSINFNDPINKEAESFLKNLLGKEAIMDDKTILLNEMEVISQHEMKELANLAKQPVSLELNKIGDIKEVAGTKYIATEKGWVKYTCI